VSTEEQRLRLRAEIYGFKLRKMTNPLRWLLHDDAGRMVVDSTALSTINEFLDERLVKAVKELSQHFIKATAEVLH